MRQVGLPRRIGLIFMVYKAPADRISVRGRAAFCFFREASAVSADTGLDPGGIGELEALGWRNWGYRRLLMMCFMVMVVPLFWGSEIMVMLHFRP